MSDLIERINKELEGVILPDRRGRMLLEARDYIKQLESDALHEKELRDAYYKDMQTAETERDQFMEQAALRDQRDVDMQEIMKINNELKNERDALADHLARAQDELGRLLRVLKI